MKTVQSMMLAEAPAAVRHAGVDNELFFRDNTMMLFADAKVMCENIVKRLKEARTSLARFQTVTPSFAQSSSVGQRSEDGLRAATGS